MTTCETEVMEALHSPRGRTLYAPVLAAILQRPQAEIDQAVESLRARRLVGRSPCGQWRAYRVRKSS